jgi:hypothetical protein
LRIWTRFVAKKRGSQIENCRFASSDFVRRSGMHLWALFRPTVVAQLVAGMLRMEVSSLLSLVCLSFILFGHFPGGIDIDRGRFEKH